MVAQRHLFHRVPVARRVLRGKVPELPPIPAPVQLAVSGGEIPKGVERRIVRVADYGLFGKGVQMVSPCVIEEMDFPQ